MVRSWIGHVVTNPCLTNCFVLAMAQVAERKEVDGGGVDAQEEATF
jgi:hypothetical protein